MMIFNKGKGFTLIEVMVSLAILAITLGVIVKSSVEQTKQLSYLRDKTYAYFLAENILSELKIKKFKINKGVTKSTKSFNGQLWYVEQIVTETQAKNILDNFMELRIEIRRSTNAPLPLVSLHTYFTYE